jgi:hypothetical protein
VDHKRAQHFVFLNDFFLLQEAPPDSKKKDFSEEEKDDESEEEVEGKRRYSKVLLSMTKYQRLTKRVALLKSELALSRKRELAARAELAKLRDEVLLHGNEKSDDDERTNQLILKHSAKVKATKAVPPKMNLSKHSKNKQPKRGNKKRAVRKSTLDGNRNSDSDAAEDAYSVASEGSAQGSSEEARTLEDHETDVIHTDEENQNIDKELKQNNEKIDHTTTTTEKAKSNEKEDGETAGNETAGNEKADSEKADKCQGHKNLLNFLFEDDPRYCAEGQKFRDATCMKCSSTFVTKDTKPNSSRPIHFCPNFEDVCDAVLCHGCYMELNTSTIATRPRRNRNSSV